MEAAAAHGRRRGAHQRQEDHEHGGGQAMPKTLFQQTSRLLMELEWLKTISAALIRSS
jgi:hypothetical protein